MEPRDQLLRLLRIQELALEIRGAVKTVEDAPRKLEENEARFRERNAQYVAIKDQHDEVERDRTDRTEQLGELEHHRDKSMVDLMKVKNQREYAAMLKEIDTVKAEIAGHEEAILRDMEGLEKLTEDLQSHAEHIKKEREVVAEERREVESDVEAARTKVEELTGERKGIESDLPPRLVQTVRGLELRRQGVFLAKADNGTCLSCFVRIRPQVFQEIKLASALHPCGSCRRYLYHEPSLRPKTPDADRTGAEASVAATPPGDIEAVNGGAV